MNKHAIALAADSAITAGEKVFQSANKIFALSKSCPIEIMIYSSASYCGIPWETLIKLYRQVYPNIHFKKLHSYALHFIRFLKYNKVILSSKKSDEDIIKEFSEDFARDIVQDIRDAIRYLYYENNKIRRDKLNKEIRNILHKKFYKIKTSKASKLRSKISYIMFKNKFNDIINLVYKEFELDKYEEFIPLLNKIFIRLLYILFTSKYFPNPYSGVVFAGFGDEDIYPQLESYVVGLSILGYIQIDVVDNISINNKNTATVTPFAQSDIISLFMSGIHPDMSKALNMMFLSILNEHFKLIMDLYKIKKKDKTIDYQKVNEEIVNKIIDSMKKNGRRVLGSYNPYNRYHGTN